MQSPSTSRTFHRPRTWWSYYVFAEDAEADAEDADAEDEEADADAEDDGDACPTWRLWRTLRGPKPCSRSQYNRVAGERLVFIMITFRIMTIMINDHNSPEQQEREIMNCNHMEFTIMIKIQPNY